MRFLLVVPSVYEPFGMVALEGAACGCPVIASQTGGLAALLRRGRFGRLIPSEDIDALVEAVVTTLDRLETVRSEARESADRLLEQFSWTNAAATVLRVLRSTAGDGRSRR